MSGEEKVLVGSYEFRCSNCGAPLEVSPETIVAVCSYCGYPNWIREDLKSEIMIVEALSESKITARARERIKTDRDLKKIASAITLGKPLLVYIPYYFADAAAEADYWGRVRVTMRRCTGSGKERKCYTNTHIVTVSGHYGPFRKEYSIIGRRAVRAFSAKALGEYYLDKKPEPKPLEKIRLEKSTTRRILNVEVDQKTAIDIALDEHLDTLRARVEAEIRHRAERKADMMYPGTVVSSTIISKRIKPKNIDVKVSPITLLPLYIMPYRYGNGVYRLFLSGWDGTTIVAEEPMTLFHRILYGSAGTLVAGGAGGLAGAMFYSGSGELAIAGALVLLFGAAISYYTIRMATRPVRVEVVNERFKSLKEIAGKTYGIYKKIHRYTKYVGI